MKTSPQSEQVIIVGGGVAGLASAATLSRAGLPVILLEAGDLGQRASSHNQGWLHSGAIFAKDDPQLAQSCYQAFQHTVEVCPQCLEPTSVETLHQRSAKPPFTRSSPCLEPTHEGMFYIASRPDTLTSPWTNAWKKIGIPFEEVDREQVLRDVRGINPSRLKKVFLLPDRAFHSQVLLEDLASAARNAGCEIRTHTSVSELIVENNTIQGVKTASGEKLAARQVILATGSTQDAQLMPPHEQFDRSQSQVENVILKTHLIAIRPDVSHMPFVFLDRHQFNHLPHMQTSVFQSGEWIPTTEPGTTAADTERIAALWEDIRDIFPGVKFSEFSDVREWTASTIQAMQYDQIIPGQAPRPSVTNHALNGGPLNLWSISVGKMTLWPAVAEEIRLQLLASRGQGVVSVSRPPWELPAKSALDMPRE